MKKFIIFAFMSLFLVSCQKETIRNQSDKLFANVTFDVGEQSNVDRYEVEVSLTGSGADWHQAGIIFASNKTEDHYAIKTDVTNFFGTQDLIFVRVKSVDKDTKVQYTDIFSLNKNHVN